MTQYIKLFEDWESPEDWDDSIDDQDLDASGLTDARLMIERLAKQVEIRLALKLGEPEWDEFENPNDYDLEPEEAGAWFPVEDPTKWNPEEESEYCPMLNITQGRTFRFVIDANEIPGPEEMDIDCFYKSQYPYYPIDQLTPEYWDKVVDWCKEYDYLQSEPITESWEAPEEWDPVSKEDQVSTGIFNPVNWFEKTRVDDDGATDWGLLGLTEEEWNRWSSNRWDLTSLMQEMYQKSIDHLLSQPGFEGFDEKNQVGETYDYFFKWKLDIPARKWKVLQVFLSSGVATAGRGVVLGHYLDAQVKTEPFELSFSWESSIHLLDLIKAIKG